MRTNLVLHCGARAVGREYLSAIPCPPATESWHPIPHITLVQQVERALAASQMRILTEAYGVTEDNQRMFGLIQVARADIPENTEHAFVIGVRGAHDKTLSRGLAVGASVFVCDNMSFSSEIVMHRKSTKNILRDLPFMVDTAIGQLYSRWADQEKRIDTYKSTGVGDKDVAHMLIEMAGDVFPEQKLTDIYREFKAPRHPEFVKGTLWAMFNAVTEFLKPKADSKATGLWTMPARTGRLHKVCDDFCGLVIDVPAVVTPVANIGAAAALVANVPVVNIVSPAVPPIAIADAKPIAGATHVLAKINGVDAWVPVGSIKALAPVVEAVVAPAAAPVENIVAPAPEQPAVVETDQSVAAKSFMEMPASLTEAPAIEAGPFNLEAAKEYIANLVLPPAPTAEAVAA